jgi:leucyl/phenylalanyl-tRNA---protein transferase
VTTGSGAFTAVGACEWNFPDAGSADDDGLVAVGADLAPETLVYAYRNGIFPWPHGRMRDLPWFSPNPRGVLPLDHLKVSKTLRQTLRRTGWTTTMDAAFEQVTRECGKRPGEGTWITPAMRAAYLRLHQLGVAHSLEVWDGDELVGGLYGVMSGGVFTGESMFHKVTDASKVAVADLIDRLIEARAGLLDVQLLTDHLASLGALAIHRSLFVDLLRELRDDTLELCVDRREVSRLEQRFAPGYSIE